jgi:2-polyprenyl-3-methyl-5-hydroxy-6-metoxy-1,4-benzoquinol methylase
VSEVERLLAEQAHYYRERAGEYEDWWFRRGRYDHGTEANALWFMEVAEVEAALEQFKPAGEVLELACGTGLWTERLARHAASVTALDGSPEMLDLCRARVNDPRVRYIQADLFAWEPDRAYDVCFFGFWLSHVPEERFETFWQKVRRAVEPRGRVFFLDSLRSDLASATDHKLPDPDDHTMLRRLADGREYRIVKRFHEPQQLQRRLAGLGWKIEVHPTPTFFIHGQGQPAGRDAGTDPQ